MGVIHMEGSGISLHYLLRQDLCAFIACKPLSVFDFLRLKRWLNFIAQTFTACAQVWRGGGVRKNGQCRHTTNSTLLADRHSNDDQQDNIHADVGKQWNFPACYADIISLLLFPASYWLLR
jgi:hypothetical protein